MSGRIILDLCGGTGSWSKPYREAGYDVRVVTLPDQDVRLFIPPEEVYGILAAPPCQHFSVMRTDTTSFKPRDLVGAMENVKACLGIIERSQLKKKPLKFWALENPRGMLRRFLGRPPFEFQPWEYGDPYSKKTDLWGYFNLPTKNPVPLLVNKEHQRKHHVHPFPSAKEYPGVDRAGRRAITPQGFAQAFFEANP